MFVFPLAHASRRAASPQFGRFLERVLDDSVDTRPSTRTPALDVSETDAGYTLSFDVPGVTRAQLEVSVEGRRVSIETVDAPAAAAEAAPDAPQAAAQPAPRVLYRERPAPRYARSVSLPAEVDAAKATARFENGVLTLELVKKVPGGAVRIDID